MNEAETIPPSFPPSIFFQSMRPLFQSSFLPSGTRVSMSTMRISFRNGFFHQGPCSLILYPVPEVSVYTSAETFVRIDS